MLSSTGDMAVAGIRLEPAMLDAGTGWEALRKGLREFFMRRMKAVRIPDSHMARPIK